MSKKSAPTPVRGGWSRYPVQLAGIRISAPLAAAIVAHAAALDMRPSAYVRDALERACGLAGAQSGTQFNAPIA
jgi:hypothetical protein